VTDPLVQLDTWAGALLARLQPAERRKLAQTIARDLRRSQQRRIARQQAPDGTPYPPRKPQTASIRGRRGAIRRKQGAMFVKLRTARWLKANATAERAEVGFIGRVARLARVHQYGLNDRAKRGGKEVRYARRPLMGFMEEDRTRLRDYLLDYLRNA